MSNDVHRNRQNSGSADGSTDGYLLRTAGAAALVVVLFVGMLGLSQLQSDAYSAVRTANTDLPVAARAVMDGAEIYSSRCQTCHQKNGQGVPGVFPPVDGSDWVTGDKGRLIRIILNGMTGEVEVNGTTYSGSMPPWGTFLSDEEVAQVATYVRQNWSNDTTAVTTEEVAAVRAAVEERKQPWTAEELMKTEGIPEKEAASSDDES